MLWDCVGRYSNTDTNNGWISILINKALATLHNLYQDSTLEFKKSRHPNGWSKHIGGSGVEQEGVGHPFLSPWQGVGRSLFSSQRG